MGISKQQVAKQARSKTGQKIFEVFWQEESELFVAGWARWDAQWKGLVDLERRCQDKSREIRMLSKRQDIFKNAIEGKLRVQSRASERLQDHIIEEIKEMEHTKTEEALQLVRKDHDLWMYQNEEEAKRLQGARKPRKDEEMVWAPPRNMSKWPDWEEARKLENGEWRLEPEREAEVPEVIVVSDAVEGTFLDLEGESRREQLEARFAGREREAPNEEGEEIKSPISKVNLGGIRRNTGLCERSKEYGA